MTATPRDDTEHWRRIDALLTELLALAPEAREARLASLPESDRAMQGQLRRMLARAEQPHDDFMRRPVSDSLLGESGADAAPEMPGTEVGPYRLLRELGSGGMGRVWLAERTDGSLRRQVALKLPRSGWARGVAERLAQERDALAALEHPNIARLYDAGVTQGGRPYIAMEYIDGLPITDYVSSKRCTLRERLQLFLQVTTAVAFAHANLVVHRDIKPHNILVTNDGTVHLLDFGAAKLLGRDDERHLTRILGGAMSPEYASPEQIRGDRITVATDVYSLGVLLFELLTGSRPYELRRLGSAALEEAIVKADIPKASAVPTLAKGQVRQLRGDIDAILGKAMRLKPAARYPSVQALADDIERHLAGEPILARRPGAGYRLWKFARRHRLGVAMTAVVLLALGSGAVVSLWQANLARQQAARAERVKQFVISIFTQAVPRNGIGGPVTAADLLGVAASRLDRELADDPGVAAEIGVIIADSYDALGYTNETVPILRNAVTRAQRAFGPDAPVTLDARLSLVSGIMLQDPEGALAILSDLLPRLIRHFPANARRAASALRDKSFALAKLNRRDESYAALRLGIDFAERYLGPDREDTIYMIGLLSNTQGRFGDRVEQLRNATEALQRATRVFGAHRPHNTLIAVERWYADALRENDRPGDAVPILRRVYADQLKLDGAVTQRVRNAQLQLGNALARVGEAGEALALIREAVALERAQNAVDTDDRAGFAEALASVLALSHRIDEALAQNAYLEQLAGRLQTDTAGRKVARNLRQARLLILDGRADDAMEVLQRTVGQADGMTPDEWFQMGLARALVLRQSGAGVAALALLRELQSDRRYAQQRLALRSGVETELGLGYLDLGQVDKAVEPLKRCEQLYVQAQIVPSVRVAGCMIGLARLQLAQGRGASAVEPMQQLVRSWQSANPGSPFHGEALYWLSRAQRAAGKVADADRNMSSARRMLASGKARFLRQLLADGGAPVHAAAHCAQPACMHS